MAFSGVFGIAIGQLLWYRGVKVLGNTRTAVYQNVVPIGAIAVAWAWLDEIPNAGQLAGAAIVVGGVAVVRRSVRVTAMTSEGCSSFWATTLSMTGFMAL